MAADILGRSAALCAMCSRPAYDPRSQYPLGRPWNLGPIGISAEIRWAVCHGYIAGKNGRMVWLCRLDGVGNETPSDLVVPTPSVPANRKWLYDLLHRKNPPTIVPKKPSFKDELREYFKFPPQKSKQCEKTNQKEAPRTYCGTEYDFIEEFRRSDTFTALDLLLDWCDDMFTEKITPSLVQRFRNLDDHWLLSEIRGLRSQTADVTIEARKSDRKDLIMKVLIASEQHRIQHETRALIDSGCTVSCINEETVKKFNLEKKPLEHAVPVRNADGTLNAAGSITHVVTA